MERVERHEGSRHGGDGTGARDVSLALQPELVLNRHMILPQVIPERRPLSSAAAPDPLRVLPAGERDVISLVQSQRLSYREAATVLGIDDDTAKRRIRSGLRRLRAEMLGPGLATA